jgi:HSP20 family protein
MLSRYDPFREAMSLRRAMDELFAQSFVNPAWMGSTQQALAPMDVQRTDQGYQVRAALPGVKPEDVEVTVNQNTLTIRGRYQSSTPQEQQGQPQEQQGTSQGQQGNWMMREISAGAFERSVTFDRPIDVDHIESKYENGILTLNLPVSEASRPRRISIGTGQQSQQIPTQTEQSQG